MKRHTLLLASLASLFALACNDGADHDTSSDKADNDDSDVVTPDISGNYGFVVKGVFRTCEPSGTLENPGVCGDERRSYYLAMRGLTTIAQNGSGIEASYELCDMTLTNLHKKTVTDEETLQQPLRKFGAIASFKGAITKDGENFKLDVEDVTLPLGLDPNYPSRFVAQDDDADGETGITISGFGSYVHFGVRWNAGMELRVDGGSLISGEVTRYGTETKIFAKDLGIVAGDQIRTFMKRRIIDEAEDEEEFGRTDGVEESYRITLKRGLVSCGSLDSDRDLPPQMWHKDKNQKWWDTDG